MPRVTRAPRCASDGEQVDPDRDPPDQRGPTRVESDPRTRPPALGPAGLTGAAGPTAAPAPTVAAASSRRGGRSAIRAARPCRPKAYSSGVADHRDQVGQHRDHQQLVGQRPPSRGLSSFPRLCRPCRLTSRANSAAKPGVVGARPAHRPTTSTVPPRRRPRSRRRRSRGDRSAPDHRNQTRRRRPDSDSIRPSEQQHRAAQHDRLARVVPDRHGERTAGCRGTPRVVPSSSVQRLARAAAACGLPADLLELAGVDLGAVQRVDRARDAGVQAEIAAVARSGTAPGPARPGRPSRGRRSVRHGRAGRRPRSRPAAFSSRRRSSGRC